MIRRMKLNEKGFTLIELMVVVAIIGILAAIAIPPVIRYLKDARNASALHTAENTLSEIKSCWTKGGEAELLPLDGDYSFTCKNCTDPDDDIGIGEGIIIAGDTVMEITPSPASPPVKPHKFLIKAYHEKGDKTYCLYEPHDVSTEKGIDQMCVTY